MTAEALLQRAGLAALSAFVCGLALVPLTIALARRFGFMAAPRPDRWSQKPTALMGGVAIYLSATIATIAFVPDLQRLLGLYAAATLVFAAGLVDDIFGMRPHHKLAAQVVAACVLIGFGVHFAFAGHPFLSLAISLLFVVGITNALNLLDNMDGLAAGVSLVCALVLLAGGTIAGRPMSAITAGALAGSCLAFLIFNRYPARIFMGDCGSMFLGLALAGLAIRTSGSITTMAGAILFPAIVLAIPIFDTAFVTIMRTINGRAISEGGCDHTSHRLVKLGLSAPQTVLLLCSASLLFGGLGIPAMMYRSSALWLTGAVAAALLLVFGRVLAQVQVYPEDRRGADSEDAGFDPVRMYKRHFATALADVLLAIAAYLAAAEALRAAFPGGAGSAPWLLAPAAVAGAAVGLGAAGVYGDIRASLSTPALMRIILGAAIAGAACFAVGVAHSGLAEALLLSLLYAAILAALCASARLAYGAAARAISAAAAKAAEEPSPDAPAHGAAR